MNVKWRPYSTVERVLARAPFWWDAAHPKRGDCGVAALDNEVAA